MFQNEKTPVQAIKTTSSKGRKIEIFTKGSTRGFGRKNGHFSNYFFQAIYARKKCFTIFYNEKTPFYAIKTTSSKSRKFEIFPKGLTHGFGQKNGHFFQLLFLGNIGQENVFYDILQRKNAFLAIKTTSSKSRKIKIFPKGLTHAFGPKKAIFPTFFF